MPQNPINLNASVQGGTALAKYLLGKQSDLTVGQLHGSKYRAAYGGSGTNLFYSANQTAVTTSAGLATTYVGLCLSNPAGSGVNLEVRRVRGLFVVAPAAVTAFSLIVGFAVGGVTVHTTPIAPAQTLIGSTAVAALGKTDSACTLVGTPVYHAQLAVTPSPTSQLSFSEDMEGALTLIPGAYVAIGTTIAGPAAGFLGSIEWAEAVI